MRIAVWLVVVILVLIVLWQNWGPVDTPILFMTVRMPRTLFMLLMVLAGFVIGLATPGLRARKKDEQ